MAMRSKADKRKIILLLLLIIVMLIAGVLAIDFVGNIYGVRVPIPGMKFIKSMSLKKKIKISEDPYLLEREELFKEKERLSIYEEQIINRERELSEKELASDRKLETLKEKEAELEKKAELLNQKERSWQNTQDNIREQAVKLYNMPPNDAVVILEKQKESDIVDILRAIDAYSEELGRQSTSPYMLKLLNDINKEKAANVLRKLKYISSDYNSSVESIEDDDAIPAP